MRLLGVEREDSVRESRIVGQERGDRAQSELLRGCQAVASVRGPEPIAARDRDHRVQEQARRTDRRREAVRVSTREVALEGRRLDARDREGCEHERQAAVRIAIGGENRTLGLLDSSGEGSDVLVAAVEHGFAGFRPPRFRGSALAARRLARRGLLRRGLLCGTHDSPPAWATSGTC